MQIKLIRDDSLQLVTRHIIHSKEGKFSFAIDQEGHYKICAQNVIPTNLHKVFMKMKIESDTLEEIDYKKVITKSDLSPVGQKIDNIIRNSQNIIERQKRSMEDENKSYDMQHKYSNFLVGIFVFQILLVLLVGVVQLYWFKRYLVFNKVL